MCGSHPKQQYIADLPNLNEGGGIPPDLALWYYCKDYPNYEFSVSESIVIVTLYY